MDKFIILFLLLHLNGFGQKTTSESKQTLNQKDLQRKYSDKNKRVNNFTPILNMNELRMGNADTAEVVYINDGTKSGIFRYNDKNTRSKDDSSMVIVVGKRRYEREYLSIKPEFFGANANDDKDDGPSIQKALNIATERGLKVVFSEGTYITSITLVPKIVVPGPVFAYRLTLEGAGSGLTKIKAIHEQDILRMIKGQKSFTGRESNVLIKDLELDGNAKAAHCINANHIANFKIIDCKLTGATQSNLKIGEGISENFGIDIIRCYSGGKSVNEGHNNAGVELINCRYTYIDRLTTDGSKFGIYMDGSDKGFITNCHLEGSKVAAIRITGTGGGEHKISNNMLMPYVQYEPSAKFDGELFGLKIDGSKGGGSANIIYGNIFIVPDSASLPIKTSLAKASKTLRANPNLIISGNLSSAKGYLIGYDILTNKALIQTTSGQFREGEGITQSTTGGVATIGKIFQSSSKGIMISGSSDSNIISNNQIRLNPTIGIDLSSNNNIVSNNIIEASTGVSKNGDFAILVGNIINSKNSIALKNMGGKIELNANQFNGKVIGLPDTK
ncbi:parallel beta-helix repeat (two copies) [Dyadobacter koreensis]|uniref:Parallel beta-helix repeat (Two copies) n=1 Tax=Dyadobacter koreensis TaxID=408657 RepID=A0A1H6R8H3_9BACT|nr:hypothetical protein [Dyadobacter koreensis]SEI52043.1 parallel beta-helix repeat (two copies) [Dyadobacter koreensis]